MRGSPHMRPGCPAPCLGLKPGAPPLPGVKDGRPPSADTVPPSGVGIRWFSRWDLTHSHQKMPANAGKCRLDPGGKKMFPKVTISDQS